MKYEVILTFTGRGLSGMAAHGGSGHWAAAPNNLRKASHLICVRNRRREHEEWAAEDLPHGQAFLLAKVTGVSEAPHRAPNKKQRYIVHFDEYAEIAVPNAWQKFTDGQRFPVAYSSRKNVEALLGIDFEDPNLEWKRLSDLAPAKGSGDVEEGTNKTPEHALTVEQAKQGLALHFGVNPEQIDIQVHF